MPQYVPVNYRREHQTSKVLIHHRRTKVQVAPVLSRDERQRLILCLQFFPVCLEAEILRQHACHQLLNVLRQLRAVLSRFYDGPRVAESFSHASHSTSPSRNLMN